MFQKAAFAFAFAVALFATASIAGAEEPRPTAPVLGTVKVPAYDLPPSAYLSAEARKLLANPGPALADGPPPPPAIPGIRAAMKHDMAPLVAALTSQYGVTVSEATVGGVHGYWVKPAKPPAQRGPKVVLLNLPAGGFMIGQADPIGLVESIPIAGLGGFDVLTIDYRQAPEAKFPAASEDVEKVYRALLKGHAPDRIGVFGTSAGGLLTAQSLAWFQHKGLPAPGAVGILAASADGLWGGDSWYWQKPIQGQSASPTLDEALYYAGHDTSDPLLSPMVSPDVLRRFPPTLLVSATRAGELSSTVNTHRLLVRLGVTTELHVWDGLGHAFFGLHPELPESREVFDVTVRFFSAHLGKRTRK